MEELARMVFTKCTRFLQCKAGNFLLIIVETRKELEKQLTVKKRNQNWGIVYRNISSQELNLSLRDSALKIIRCREPIPHLFIYPGTIEDCIIEEIQLQVLELISPQPASTARVINIKSGEEVRE